MSTRDRRALLLLAAAVGAFLALQYGVFPRVGGGGPAGSSTSIDVTERRLRRLQQVAQRRPQVAAEAEAASRDLAEAEKGLLKAATSALALAEMQQILKELLKTQGINLQSSEFGAVKVLGEDYAQVPLAVTFACGIDQWINLMAALRNAPHLLASLETRIAPGDQKMKTLQVRMVVAGYIPASLAAPKRAGGASL